MRERSGYFISNEALIRLRCRRPRRRGAGSSRRRPYSSAWTSSYPESAHRKCGKRPHSAESPHWPSRVVQLKKLLHARDRRCDLRRLRGQYRRYHLAHRTAYRLLKTLSNPRRRCGHSSNCHRRPRRLHRGEPAHRARPARCGSRYPTDRVSLPPFRLRKSTRLRAGSPIRSNHSSTEPSSS